MFDGLLFDLDGTLWDSVDSICLSWNRVLARIAPQYAGQITRPRLIGCMGMLLPDIVKKLLPDLDWKDIQPLLDGLLKEENAHVARHGGILYPQVPETLELLARDSPCSSSATVRTATLRPSSRPTAWGSFSRTTRTPAAPGSPRGTTSPWWYSATV